MDPIVIRVDAEITLKLHQVEYSEMLFNLIDGSRFHLRHWLGWVDNTRTVEDAKTYIENSLESYKNTGNFDLGIWYKEQLVGTVGIHDLKKISRNCALGYWLSEEFTGEGIMSRSVKALIDYLFKVWQLHRIEIQCGVKNVKSAAIAERFGFKFEGVAREAEWLYDHYHDLNVYSMLENEWSDQNPESVSLGYP